jgi:NCAIR mutase (PurE)-related protein
MGMLALASPAGAAAKEERLVVVNVDNGFGAAHAAATIAHRIAQAVRQG